jgi:subtilisin family serine protease
MAKHREDRILVMPKTGVNTSVLAAAHAAGRSAVLRTFPGLRGLQVVGLPPGESVAAAIARYERSGLVEFAEPDYARELALAPNDPYFVSGALWGLDNYGQSSGTNDADIDAPEAWDVLHSASNIVVAILDTGITKTHEDLTANIWTNLVDGGYGWNALATNNLPGDDEGHGSLVAGVIGAEGNNGLGIAGVAWQVQLMAGKCFNSSRIGYDSDIIACMDYARTNGARIVNASLSGTNYSASLSNATVALRDAGIILVTSAGNNAKDIDVIPFYPACYELDNIVTVTATRRTDTLWSLSNYGATQVDLAAPGEQIYSTFNNPSVKYLTLSGTSLAAPHVSGTLALMLAKFPGETHQQIIARLLAATDPVPALAGKCVTGGRLNLHKALSPPIQLTPTEITPFQFRVAAGPNRQCVIEASTNLVNWQAIATNTTAVNGTFDFTNGPGAGWQFFRASAAP